MNLDTPKKRHIYPSCHPFPLRCFTCGKPVGFLWSRFCEAASLAEPVLSASTTTTPDPATFIVNDQIPTDARYQFMDANHLRECCRRMLLTHKDMVAVRLTKGQIYT